MVFIRVIGHLGAEKRQCHQNGGYESRKRCLMVVKETRLVQRQSCSTTQYENCCRDAWRSP